MFYSYSEELIYTGETAGQRNPKTGEQLKPARTTTVAPPFATEDETPRFRPETDDWELIESDLKKQKTADNLLLLDEVNDLGIFLYEEIDGVAVARSASIISSESNAASIQAQIKAASDTMDLNVVTKAMEITSTTGPTSAQASVSAFQLRVLNAGAYVGQGLVVRYASGSYVKGAVLNTELDIIAYYNAVLVELDLFREAAISTYITQKTALEAI